MPDEQYLISIVVAADTARRIKIQEDVIARYTALPQALRIAREIAREERRADALPGEGIREGDKSQHSGE
jgi:hypothetical protein